MCLLSFAGGVGLHLFVDTCAVPDHAFEIVRRDTIRDEHEVTTATSINDIARDLAIWMAARDFPGRPTGQVSEI